MSPALDWPELAGRVAIVTGAAGTMGGATVAALRGDGLRIAALDLRPFDTGDPGIVSFVCDLSRADAVADTVAQVRDRVGPVTVLVNNAGILSNNKLAATSTDEWHRVLAANLDSAFYLAQAVMPDMLAAGWGRIVNTCSMAAKSGGLTAGTAYTTSKGALIALTFSLAREYARHGITVNGVAPAYVRTPMVTEQLTEAQRQALLAQIPVGRFCEPEEFAHVVRFLVSPLSGFITGEIIDVNGGLIMD